MTAPVSAPVAPAASRPAAVDAADADRFGDELAAATSQLESESHAGSSGPATDSAESAPESTTAPTADAVAPSTEVPELLLPTAGAAVALGLTAPAAVVTAQALVEPTEAPAEVTDTEVVAADALPSIIPAEATAAAAQTAAAQSATAPAAVESQPAMSAAAEALPAGDDTEIGGDAEGSTATHLTAPEATSDVAPAATIAPIAPAIAIPSPSPTLAEAPSEPAPSTNASAPVATVTATVAPLESSATAVMGAASAPESPVTAAAATPSAPVIAPTVVDAARPIVEAQAPAAASAPSRAEAAALVPQLARPLQGLRTAGDGSHTLTISVTPETLGPVTVRAHVQGDQVRIELVAPTDQAREALKSILTDLRRDLAQSSTSPSQSFSLDLANGQGSGADRGQETQRGERGGSIATGETIATPRPERTRAANSLLDVLA